jgi:hypothetical protein
MDLISAIRLPTHRLRRTLDTTTVAAALFLAPLRFNKSGCESLPPAPILPRSLSTPASSFMLVSASECSVTQHRHPQPGCLLMQPFCLLVHAVTTQHFLPGCLCSPACQDALRPAPSPSARLLCRCISPACSYLPWSLSTSTKLLRAQHLFCLLIPAGPLFRVRRTCAGPAEPKRSYSNR